MRVLLALLLVSWSFAAPAAASADGRPLHFRGDNVVRARLRFDTTTLRPGEPATASIELTPDPGWHLYGPEHGDAGEPPDIAWKTPIGVRAGSIVFPPSRRVVAHGMTTYEYHGPTTLRVLLSATQSARVTKAGPIRADVSWVVCSNVCVPGRTTLAGTIAIGSIARKRPMDSTP